MEDIRQHKQQSWRNSELKQMGSLQFTGTYGNGHFKGRGLRADTPTSHG